MKNTRLDSPWFLSLLGACVIALSACDAPTSGEATTASDVAATSGEVTTSIEPDLFAERDANAFDPATIDAIGDKVAEWQIANLDNLSDYMRNYRNNIADRRG